ncbi:MAG: TonB-dependent receptor [Gemmatimonadaceae bacterium]
MGKRTTGNWMRTFGGTFAALAMALPAVAGGQDSTARRLEPVRVTVSRDAARSVLDLPFGVSRIAVDSARQGIRRASLTEMLLTVPGLAVSDRFNPTQDPRLAVRGFGSRAAFGIRGVRVVRDGVPLTLADGQTAVDFVDLEAVASAEVMRGAAGALYGNASGGVLELKSDPLPVSGIHGSLRGVTNADANRWSGRVSGASDAFGWRGTLSRNTADGPRDYARFRSTSALGDATWRGENGSLRAQFTWYDAPLAENPGAVTARELRTSPTVADSLNIRKHASKAVSQKLLSLTGDRGWDGGSASASIFGGVRDLENPLAFAIIAFARRTMGATARVQQGGLAGGHAWRLTLGADVQSQRDDRNNFANCAGLSGAQRPASTCPTAADRGALTVHQLEKVANGGLFARGEVTRARVTATATLRGDQTVFSVRDKRPSSVVGGPVESRDMGAVTPMFGVAVRVRPRVSVYGNIAGSFETPTTTELANSPDGSGGLNRDLKPQRGRTLEAGAKGVIGGRVLFDLAVFDISTRDELIPFEIPNSGGRRYFRNAGRTSRRGAELGVTAALGAVDVGAALTRLIYTYEKFTLGTANLQGKRVPGVAPATASAFATARRKFGFATLEMQQSARSAADDQNSNYAPGYVLWNARVGLTCCKSLGIDPVVGVDNMFDRTYASNVVANASRGRFYEPGAGRRVYVALRVGR